MINETVDRRSKSGDESSSFNDLTLLYVRFLRIIGLLPFEARGDDFLPSRVLRVYCLVTLYITCSMFMAYGVNHLKQGDLHLDYVTEIIPAMGLTVKFTILSIFRGELLEIFSHSRNLWNNCTESERKVVQNFEKKIRLFFKLYLGNGFSSSFIYIYLALTTRLPPVEPDGSERKSLVFKFYVDDVSTSPAYELIFSLQTILSLTYIIVLVNQDTVMPLLIMLGCGYFKVIRGRLDHLYELDDSLESPDCYDIYDELVVCFRLHQSVLNICTKIQRLASMMFFIQLLCSGYIISITGLKFLSSDPDKSKFVPIFIMYVMQLYFCHWAPDLLIQESQAISTAAYFASLSNKSNLRTRKLLMIVIQRTQRPVTLMAANFVNLSIETFGSMITSAISFFTALRSFTVNDSVN